MSHTPGPWVFDKNRQGTITIYCASSDIDLHVAYTSDLHPPFQESNARLICKSPNMYRWMTRLRECSSQGLAKIPDEMHDELAEILSAIEEGEQ